MTWPLCAYGKLIKEMFYEVKFCEIQEPGMSQMCFLSFLSEQLRFWCHLWFEWRKRGSFGEERERSEQTHRNQAAQEESSLTATHHWGDSSVKYLALINRPYVVPNLTVC